MELKRLSLYCYYTSCDLVDLVRKLVSPKEQESHLVLNLRVAGMSSAIVEYAELCKFSGFG